MKQYPYRPAFGRTLGGLVFFGACGAFGWRQIVREADHGWLFGVELHGAAARALWQFTFVASCLFVVVAIGALIFRVAAPQMVSLSEDSITLPKDLRHRKVRVVPFAEIKSVTFRDVMGQRMLDVVYASGRFTLVASMLPNDEAFSEIRRTLEQASSR